MKNSSLINTKNEESWFVRLTLRWPTFCIIACFIMVSVIIALPFHKLMPMILSYPPGLLEDKIVYYMMNGYSYSAAYWGTFLVASLVCLVPVGIYLKGLNSWRLVFTKHKNIDQINAIHKLQAKCINAPHFLLVMEVMFTFIALFGLLLFSILFIGNVHIHYCINAIKSFLLFFPIFSSIGIITFIFTRGICKNILLKIDLDGSFNGIRAPFKKYLAIHLNLMFVVGIMMISLIAYAKLIEEKGELLHKIHKEILTERFNLSVVYDANQLEDILRSIKPSVNTSRFFFLGENNEEFVSDDKPLYRDFKIYLKHLSPKFHGKVHVLTGELQAATMEIQTNKGKYWVGIQYLVASKEMVKYFIIGFISLLIINGLLLLHYSYSISNEISAVTKNLLRIAEDEHVDLDKRIPVVSNDEIGDLVVAFNKVQRQFKKNYNKIKQSEESKRVFISNISHEFKTPLSIALGNIDLLLDTMPEEKHEQYTSLQNIKASILQLAGHADRMITFALAEEPEYKPIFAQYDYIRVIKNVLSQFESKATHEEKTLDFKVDAKSLYLNIDIILIEEVLRNLLQNAFKFTSRGAEISISIKELNGKVETIITDTGIGIDSDKIESVFDRFFQADDALSPSHGGTGLGLYICKRNIQIHDGDITVSSQKSKGTSFTVTLPMPEKPKAVNEAPPVHSESPAQDPTFDYTRYKSIDSLENPEISTDFVLYENQSPEKPGILIVEDNTGMLKVIVGALQNDFNLFIAQNGLDALQRLQLENNSVRLVLTDIMMPEMDGFELCECIMKNDQWKEIPILIISALMSEKDQLRGYKLGAADYLIKPFSTKILREKVTHWITRRQYESFIYNMYRKVVLKNEQLKKTKDIVVHEIKNYNFATAGSVRGIEKIYTSLIKGNVSLPDSFERYISNLKECYNHQDGAIKSILHIGQFEDQEIAPIAVPTLIKKALAITTSLTHHMSLTVNSDIKKESQIKCNQELIVQVLINLVKNAVEAIAQVDRKGEISISLTEKVVKLKKYCAIEINDNGIGMNKEVQKKVFNFKYTTKKDGSGIGMHFVKMIVKLHEGSIDIHSEEGEGSRITVSLPLVEQEAAVSV